MSSGRGKRAREALRFDRRAFPFEDGRRASPWSERQAAGRMGSPNNATPGLRLLRPPTVIGQFHTLFFGSVRMFFLGVLGFAVYGNEALHFSCEPDKREVNLFCYNQFRPITPQDHP
ncbi:putative gap junction epsilon-1 protein isoform X2 [Anolis carolinensis]|uniref:putative gap junction epsilon-1 protein isoform X2 n=1 Tax=Anolis carolinensis TaxID=28377 RepID=UPI002F2B5C77